MAVANTKHCLICSVINAFILFITVLNGEDVPLFKKETEIYSSVVLPCPGKSQQNRWTHEDRNLFVRRANIGKLPKESVGLSQDYSLLIYNVTLLHDGTYQCFRNSVISVNYSLFVTVPPTLSSTLNGHDFLDGQFRISEGEAVVAICKAFHGRPAAQLTWMINQQRVNPSTHNISDIMNLNANNLTFDVTSILTMEMIAPANGTVSCVSSNQRNYPSQMMTVPYRIIEASQSEIGIQHFVIPCSVGLFVLLQCGIIAILKRRRAWSFQDFLNAVTTRGRKDEAACAHQTYRSSPAQKVTTSDTAISLLTIKTIGDDQHVLPGSSATDIEYERNLHLSGSTWTLSRGSLPGVPDSNDDSVQDSEICDSSYSKVY